MTRAEKVNSREHNNVELEMPKPGVASCSKRLAAILHALQTDSRLVLLITYVVPSSVSVMSVVLFTPSQKRCTAPVQTSDMIYKRENW